MRNLSEHPLLQKAIALAEAAHAGQIDKAGKPYIGHPIRVMNAMETLDEKIVGLLHDAVEDSDLALETLAAQGFSGEALLAIDAITKRDGEHYEDYLARVVSNKIALRVKIADMTDNMSLSRIERPSEKDFARLKKYESILPRLKTALENFQARQNLR